MGSGKSGQVWCEDIFFISGYSSNGLQDRLFKMALMETPYVDYHELTKVAKTLENCGHLRLQKSDRKHTTNLRTLFSTLIFYSCHRSSYSFVILSLQHFLAEILFIVVEELKTFLIQCFA